MPVENRVKHYRNQSQLSQEQLALKAGVSRSIVLALEKDPRKGVSTTTLEKLAKVLDVPTRDLLIEVPA